MRCEWGLLTYLPTYLLTHLLTYLLTYSVKQSPSWEASWFSASQEIPRILWNTNVYYHIHNWPPLVPTLSQLDPILIVFLHLHLGLLSGLFPSGFPTKTMYTRLLSPIRATCPAQLPCYLVPLRPKYSPQHPILQHSQPTFLPQCEWPSFTPLQNNRQNYISVYLNL
jgi:hypothetical protein